MAATLSVRSNCSIFCREAGSTRIWPPPYSPETARIGKLYKSSRSDSSYRILLLNSCRRTLPRLLRAESRADDSASDMTVDTALQLLGLSEGASFDEILRAKKSIIAGCKDDQDMITQVETAYDKLLLQSLSQRKQGKVVNKSVRYADVKPVTSNLPQWLRRAIKNSPISVESPTSNNNLGLQAGVYATLTVLSYVSGTSSGSNDADVAGLILAAGFGASLYFMTKRNVKLGKAALITTGGVVVGAVVGSTVENLLQVDIVPFLGIHSPATVITEFIIISQFLVSLYLR